MVLLDPCERVAPKGVETYRLGTTDLKAPCFWSILTYWCTKIDLLFVCNAEGVCVCVCVVYADLDISLLPRLLMN